MLDPKPLDKSRKKPTQARSKLTVATILEAAAQVLDSDGETSLTTKVVAERAGVSIGTLYQYFSDRDAILLALAEEERQRIATSMRKLVDKIDPSGPIDAVREFLRGLIRFYARRTGAKRQHILMGAVKSNQGLPTLQDEFAEVLAQCWNRTSAETLAPLNKTHAYVLTHSILGVLRIASMQNSAILRDPKFEDALCLMILALRPTNPKAKDKKAKNR